MAPSTASASESRCQDTSELTGERTARATAARRGHLPEPPGSKIKPNANPGNVILSGNRWVSASVKIRPSREPDAQS